MWSGRQYLAGQAAAWQIEGGANDLLNAALANGGADEYGQGFCKVLVERLTNRGYTINAAKIILMMDRMLERCEYLVSREVAEWRPDPMVRNVVGLLVKDTNRALVVTYLDIMEHEETVEFEQLEVL